MKILLLHIWHALLRVRNVIVGENQATYNRLKRAGRISVGAHTYGIPILKDYVYDETKLIVGKYSALSETSIVMLGGEHAMDRVTTWPHRIVWNMEGAGQDGIPVHTGDTVIGNDVWLTQRTFLRSGVHIGDGAVIAAGAVVTKDVPPYAIVGGNPAKVLRFRFTEQQRADLLDIKWWDWSDEEVRAAVPYLASDDIDAFIAYARERQASGAVPRSALPAPAEAGEEPRPEPQADLRQ
jgi:acetyltransferase-like isoleucine patch superfamily enzyme